MYDLCIVHKNLFDVNNIF